MALRLRLTIILMADYSVSTELDTKSEECQRFFRDGLTTSFHKILNDEAVNGWKYEIHVSCKTAYYSWTSANTYLLPPRSWESCRHTSCKLWCTQYLTQGLTYKVKKSFHDGVSVLLWRGDCMWSSSYKRLFWEKVLIIDLFCFSTESHSQKHREACRVVRDKTFTGLVSFAWPSFFGV